MIRLFKISGLGGQTLGVALFNGDDVIHYAKNGSMDKESVGVAAEYRLPPDMSEEQQLKESGRGFEKLKQQYELLDAPVSDFPEEIKEQINNPNARANPREILKNLFAAALLGSLLRSLHEHAPSDGDGLPTGLNIGAKPCNCPEGVCLAGNSDDKRGDPNLN